MAILKLITDYLSAVEMCLVMFEEKFDRRDLVRAWREAVFDQSGELYEGIKYQMHGVGCAVEYPDHNVDFDFADEREVGFDAWRLWIYAEQYPERYPEYQDRTAVEIALAECLSTGTISPARSKYPGEANDKLFTLTEGGGKVRRA